MTDNQASRGELSSMNNLASGALIEGSQSLLRKDSGEDLVYEITYTVPSANITRLFSVKPTSMVLKELSLDDDYPEYGLTFAVDTSIPVIVSVFIHAKELINIAHDITLEPLSGLHPSALHYQLTPQSNKSAHNQCIFPQSLVVLQPEEIDLLRNIESNSVTNEWPLLIRIQEADQKEAQVLYLYMRLNKESEGGDHPQLIVIDQKIEMPNPFEQEGLSSFRITPVFLAAPNSSTPSPCLICLNELANLVSLPCGHLSLGDLCIKTYFEKNDNRLCLVCRQEVKELVSINDSGFDFERATEHRKELENKEENGGIFKSIEQSVVLSTFKNEFKKENSIISESNLHGEKSPKAQTPTEKSKKKHVFSMRNNLDHCKDESEDVQKKKEDTKSFSLLPICTGAKKEIQSKGDLTIKGSQGVKNLANLSRRNIEMISEEPIAKDLQSTGIGNRHSEPYLKSKKK